MFVLTVDQRDSSAQGSLARTVLPRLQKEFGPALLLPIGRFAGDELQFITDDPATTRTIAVRLTDGVGADGAWHVGIGIGEGSLGADAADSAGPAFALAREAVEAAKTTPWHLAVRAEREQEGQDAEAALALVHGIRSRRTEHGREIAALLNEHGSATEAAGALGISVSAASKRARVAMLRHESAGVRLADRLLERAASSVSGSM